MDSEKEGLNVTGSTTDLSKIPDGIQTQQSYQSGKKQANKKTLKEFLAEAKQNFQSTDGLLYALIYVFIVTFICYPGLAMNCTLNFMESIKNYEGWKFDFIQAMFNSSDCIGRYLGGITCLMLQHWNIKL